MKINDILRDKGIQYGERILLDKYANETRFLTKFLTYFLSLIPV